jgi:hypothetical protein
MYVQRPDISYDLLCVVYFLAVVLGFTFFAMERVFEMSSVEGYWIVMSPFLPCLFWGLFMKYAASPPKIAIDKDKKES